MPKKYICPFTKEDLEKAYLEDGRTIKEMCEFLGVKNTITASKVLRSYGIDTDHNRRISDKTRQGMSDAKFGEYLASSYASGKSMGGLAKELGITPSGVRKYFVKYGIPRVSRTHYLETHAEKNPNWKGGKRLCSNGYIEIYCPEHPNANKRKCVYEHQLVMEAAIGRYHTKGEVVHHIDGNKQNNSLQNLLLLTNAEHVKLHAIMNNSKERTKAGGG